jgi:hypothetical protein
MNASADGSRTFKVTLPPSSLPPGATAEPEQLEVAAPLQPSG